MLLALGLIDLFSTESLLFGDEPPFPGHDLALVITGLLIMLPALAGIIRHLLKKRQAG